MSKVFSLVRPLLAVALGLALGLLVAWIAGESPWQVLKIMAKGAFGTPYDLGMSIFYSIPLIFTGLSVSLAFHAGLFNIGAEGQLTCGALAAAAVGALLPAVPGWLAPTLGALAAFGGGALWGAIPGWLKAHRGSHEVIVTMMMNFIAAGLASWVTLYWLRNPDTQNPETKVIGAGYVLHRFAFFGDAPVSSALFVALGAAAAVGFFLWRTVPGFELRALGQSGPAAKYAGVRLTRAYPLAMALAGGLAGLVGVAEVLGHSGKFTLGFSPDYGFLGIAVALLGRNHPVGVIAAACLFGALHKGTADLDLETEKMTREVSLILQAFIILCVSADGLWDRVLRRRLP